MRSARHRAAFTRTWWTTRILILLAAAVVVATVAGLAASAVTGQPLPGDWRP